MSSTDRQIPEVGEEIHLPGPSAQPLLVAVTTTIMLLGVTMDTPVFFLFGLITLLIVLGLWIRDARAEFKALPESHGHHDGDHGDAHASEAPAAH
jgi:flagellar biosynthesis component FlhA